MKKRLYMTQCWVQGGIEAYMKNLFDRIDRREYSIDVVLPGEYIWEHEEALRQRNINVIHYPINAAICQKVKAIKQILDDGDYDIVQVMQSYLGWEEYTIFALVSLAVRKHHHYKVILHAHNAEDKGKRTSFIKKVIRGIFRNSLRIAFSGADMLVACSREAGEFLYGHKKPVEIFYNGINLNRFISAGNYKDLQQWREKYGIDVTKMNFAIVARMSDQKNPLFALDVIQALAEYYPNVNLLWVGAGEMRQDIEAHIEKLGIAEHVQLLGTQERVEEILACCDYFFLPSKFEGLGIVFIEAQAAGLRCFTSDNVPALADCGGVTFLSLEKTAEQWAEEIHRQIEAEPEAKIDMERLSRFDINRTVADLSKVYDRLTER